MKPQSELPIYLGNEDERETCSMIHRNAVNESNPVRGAVSSVSRKEDPISSTTKSPRKREKRRTYRLK